MRTLVVTRTASHIHRRARQTMGPSAAPTPTNAVWARRPQGLVRRFTGGLRDPVVRGRLLVRQSNVTMLLPVSDSPKRRQPTHPAVLWSASALLLAAAFGCDVLTGSEVASSLFYIVAILFGAWFVSERAGRVLAMLSVVCWWMAYVIAAKPFTHSSTLYWNLLAELTIYLIVAVAVSQTRLALDRLRSTAQQLAIARDALEKETRAVGDLQREMLPQEPPSVPGYTWETAYITSTRAGGDYYDFLRAPDGRVGIVVADASGHGAPAAVLMAMLRVLIHGE